MRIGSDTIRRTKFSMTAVLAVITAIILLFSCAPQCRADEDECPEKGNHNYVPGARWDGAKFDIFYAAIGGISWGFAVAGMETDVWYLGDTGDVDKCSKCNQLFPDAGEFHYRWVRVDDADSYYIVPGDGSDPPSLKVTWTKIGTHTVVCEVHDPGTVAPDNHAPVSCSVRVLPKYDDIKATAYEIEQSGKNCSFGIGGCPSCAGSSALPSPDIRTQIVRVDPNLQIPGYKKLNKDKNCKVNTLELMDCARDPETPGVCTKYWDECGKLSCRFLALPSEAMAGDVHEGYLTDDEHGPHIEYALRYNHAKDAYHFNSSGTYTIIYPDGTRGESFTYTDGVLSETKADGSGANSYEYGDGYVNVTEPNGATWQYALDGSGRISSIKSPGYPADGSFINQFFYRDATSNILDKWKTLGQDLREKRVVQWRYQEDGRCSAASVNSKQQYNFQYCDAEDNKKIVVTESDYIPDDVNSGLPTAATPIYSKTVYNYSFGSFATSIKEKAVPTYIAQSSYLDDPEGPSNNNDRETIYYFNEDPVTHERTDINRVVDPLGYSTYFTNYSTTEPVRVGTVTDALGMATTFGHNDHNHLTDITYTTSDSTFHENYSYYPMGSGSSVETSWVYQHESPHSTGTQGTLVRYVRDPGALWKITELQAYLYIHEPTGWQWEWKPARQYTYYGDEENGQNTDAGRVGQLKRITVPDIDGSTPLQLEFSYGYDGTGSGKWKDNPTQVRYQYPTGSTYVWQSTDIEYDIMGQPVRIQDANFRSFWMEYEELGRVTKEILRKDQQQLPSLFSSYEYTCCGVLDSFDPQGRQTKFGYDTISRLNAVWNEGISGQSSTSPLISAAYDSFGSVANDSTYAKSGSGQNQTMTYTYDKRNCVTDVYYPDNIVGAEHVGYDAVGNMLWYKQTDGTNRVTFYKYDQLRRLRNVYYVDNYTGTLNPPPYSSYSPNVTINYIDCTGMVSSIVDNTGTSRFYYDAVERLTRYVPAGKNPAQYMIAYTYNNLSQKTSIRIGAPNTQDPNYTSHYAYCSFAPGSVTYDAEYNYYANGWLKSITTAEGNQLIAEYHYDVAGVVDSADWGNGTSIDLTYDQNDVRYMIASATHNYFVDGAPASTTLTYGSRDGTGYPLSITDWTGQSTYFYDAEGRLKSASCPPPSLDQPTGGDYGYAWTGNRINPPYDLNKMEYNKADQLMHWPGMYTYSYYADGSLKDVYTEQGALVASYTYTRDGLLDTATYPEGSCTNVWDTTSHRVGLIVRKNGLPDRNYSFVYDPTADFPTTLMEETPEGTVYYFRTPCGGLIARRKGVEWRYFHFDETGSTRLLTDGNGNLTDGYTYDAYGNLASHYGTTSDNPYQYVGVCGYYTHYQAPEFKLLKLGVRFYDPELGRFTQIDPSGDGLNWYEYAAGNPLVYFDADGQCTELLVKTASGAVIGFIGGAARAYIGGERDPNEIAKAGGRGAIMGAIAGLTGNMAGGLGCGAGESFLAGAVSGGITGGIENAAGQLFSMAMGWQICFDWSDLGWSSLMAGVISGGTSYFSRLCFVEGTEIATPNGKIAIDDLKVSDIVWSHTSLIGTERNPRSFDFVLVLNHDMEVTGEALLAMLEPGSKVCFRGRVYELGFDRSLTDTGIVASRVVDTFARKTDTLIDLTVRSDDGVEDTVSGTPEHPFYVPAVGDYVPMEELTPGTALLSADGDIVTVVDSTIRHGSFDVYNFEVEGQHNYYVSDDEVLVHNSCVSLETHHIVEQRNLGRFGRDLIHGSDNLVVLEKRFHNRVSAYYSSKQIDLTGPGFSRVRDWMNTMDFEQQHEWGRKIMYYLLTGEWPQ